MYFAAVFRIGFILMAFVIGLSACRKKQADKNILSESEMVKVLIEMYLGDEKISRASLPYDSVTKISPLIRQRVLARLGIPDSVYLMSMDYYMMHPEKLDKIFGIVVDSLSLREQRTPVFSPGNDTPAGF
ncbi:MAG: DUF4296 domain-containing protein [Cyclobacteriaceae bacterium]|nr:DUF4296 domain-containing protein [Cyclobacteriaceae bacterium]MCX7637443.1 DUF4296 domain-containing protein [Cyclobacteriaceae bacterium]MDW8330170.1 DUF4296 domain-containing protein [Cyclobacteriaceae bacterium]